jgi:hypothetical protein
MRNNWGPFVLLYIILAMLKLHLIGAGRFSRSMVDACLLNSNLQTRCRLGRAMVSGVCIIFSTFQVYLRFLCKVYRVTYRKLSDRAYPARSLRKLLAEPSQHHRYGCGGELQPSLGASTRSKVRCLPKDG